MSCIVEIVQKTTNLRNFSPFDEVRGGVEPWLMASWKARVYDFLFVIIELFSLSLTVEALQLAKRVKTRCYQEGVGHFEARFQGEDVVPGEYFLVSTKLDTFCYPTMQNAPCCHRFDTIPACDGQTDRQTDGQTELL